MPEFIGMLLFDVKTYETEYVNIYTATSLEEAQEMLDEYVDEMIKRPVMFEVIEIEDIKTI